MHDGGRTESLHDAATQTTAIRHPAPLPLPQTGIALFFWRCGANPQLAGKARMPYKMNAQSFARMRNQQSVHKRAKDARWRSHKVGARTRRPKRPQTQGCVIVLAQSFARMRNFGQARFDNPATLSPAQQAGYYFWCGGRENPQLAGRAGMLTSNNLYNFSSNVLTNYNNILQNPFKFVILYQKTKRPITS